MSPTKRSFGKRSDPRAFSARVPCVSSGWYPGSIPKECRPRPPSPLSKHALKGSQAKRLPVEHAAAIVPDLLSGESLSHGCLHRHRALRADRSVAETDEGDSVLAVPLFLLLCATKFVEVIVQGAESERAARKIADTVANSNLVKTALFGEDANWGRILGAVGRAGVPVETERVDVFFEDVCMGRNGLGCGKKAESQATRVLKKPEFSIRIDLKSGTGTVSVFTCDFSVDYVKINADYRS